MAFFLQVSWGRRRGRAEDYTGKKIPEISFFFGGGLVVVVVVKDLIYFGGECQSVRSGWAGLGVSWLVGSWPVPAPPRLCGGPGLYGVCKNTLSSLRTYSEAARGRVSLRVGLLLKPTLRVYSHPNLGLRLGRGFCGEQIIAWLGLATSPKLGENTELY